MELEKWVTLDLKIVIDPLTLKTFSNFDEADQQKIFELTLDGARMYLMALNTAVLNLWSIEELFLFTSRGRRMIITITHHFQIQYEEDKFFFTLTQYGQMLLNQWLQEYFVLHFQ